LDRQGRLSYLKRIASIQRRREQNSGLSAGFTRTRTEILHKVLQLWDAKRRFLCVLVLASVCLSAVLVLGVFGGVSGCGKKKETPLATNVGATVSDAECQQFADNLQRAAKEGNADAIAAALDVDAIADTAFAGLEMSRKDRDDFAGGFRNSFTRPTGLNRQIVDSVAKGASFKLLRIVTVDNQKRARFRSFSIDQGINYMDFLLSRRADGQVKVVDIYLFLSGEMVSASMRRVGVLSMVAQRNRGLLARLRGVENDYLKSLNIVQSMAQAVQQEKHSEALTLYRSLPESLQKEKMVLLMRMRAALPLSDAEYTRALEDFRTHHATDPAADIVSIDYYYLRKQPDKALAALDRLDKAVGGDPFLNTLRAPILLEDNRLGEARQRMEETAKALPEETGALEMLVALYLGEERFEPIPALLEKIQTAGGSLTTLQGNPDYAAFVKSPAYKQWKNKPQN
jgi:hypothetical protein